MTSERAPIPDAGALWKMAWPTMLLELSSLGMVFVDRLLLARFSPHAFNAMLTAGALAWAVLDSGALLTESSEVLVAQAYGKGDDAHVGRVVWQALWIAAASTIVSILLAVWGGGDALTSLHDGPLMQEYFRWLIVFLPIWGIRGAVCSFFLGTGRPRLLAVAAIVGSVVNLVLDPILIFGIPSLFEGQGLRGSACATAVASLCVLLVLAVPMFRRENRLRYGVLRWQLHLPTLRGSLRIGFPIAALVLNEFIGHGVLSAMINREGIDQSVAFGICETVVIVLSFLNNGLSAAVVSVAGRELGADPTASIGKVVRSGIVLSAIFAVASGLLVIFGRRLLVQVFFAHEAAGLAGGDGEPDFGRVSTFAQTGILLIPVLTFLRCLQSMVSGLLATIEDTFFLLAAGTIAIWVVMLGMVKLVGANTTTALVANVTSEILLVLVCGFRLWRRRRDLVGETEEVAA